MNFFTSVIGLLLIGMGVDGYFNNGSITSYFITPNLDIAMTMIIMGGLVLLCSLCLCEFRRQPNRHTAKPADEDIHEDALTQ